MIRELPSYFKPTISSNKLAIGLGDNESVRQLVGITI